MTLQRAGGCLALIVALVCAAAAQSGVQGDKQFQAALHQEMVDGDLKAAIEAYRAITARPGVARELAATALLRMAECYEKLGDAEAPRIYERVLREYTDQVESSAQARTRLASLGKLASGPSGMVARRIWGGLIDATGSISPDGRVLSYVDWETGDLAVHELPTGRHRRITNKGTWEQSEDYANSSAISRDGKQVAYSWFINETRRYELRVASLEGVGVPRSRRLFASEDVSYLAPGDWSPDGNWIAVQLTRRDGTGQMGLVSVRDGSLRVLKSSAWRGSRELFFSPDGKYVGFDLPVGDAGNRPRDVLVLAVDGSHQIPAVVGDSDDTMMGWAPDGRHLLFASDRGGAIGLWATAVANGRPLGQPALIKADIGRESLGISSSGSLYSGVDLASRDIHVVLADLETGKLVGQPRKPIQSFAGFNVQPAWSPDGKSLAYVSLRDRAGRTRVVGIWSVETGVVRELQPDLNYVAQPTWATDGRSLFVQGRDLKDRLGLYQIDVQTGGVTPVVVGATGFPQLSPDGTKIYYREASGVELAFVERDLASGNNRDVIRRDSLTNPGLSPDGRFAATTYNDESIGAWVLLVVPVSRGEPRELFRVGHPQSLGRNVAWTPDGRAILVGRRSSDSGDQNEIWVVPTDGGQPYKMDLANIELSGYGFLRVHPDGKQIAYVAGDDNLEVWVLENFLPALGARQ